MRVEQILPLKQEVTVGKRLKDRKYCLTMTSCNNNVFISLWKTLCWSKHPYQKPKSKKRQIICGGERWIPLPESGRNTNTFMRTRVRIPSTKSSAVASEIQKWRMGSQRQAGHWGNWPANLANQRAPGSVRDPIAHQMRWRAIEKASLHQPLVCTHMLICAHTHTHPHGHIPLTHTHTIKWSREVMDDQ